ncbi:MAG: HTTM domain-containing protein [Sandaracinaceae bacterium]|nr:HTTM domain-containing protein [Sandaracinaceae bacterium]
MTASATVLAKLNSPRDNASLAAFRIAFGLAMFVASLRFVAQGWIPRFYEEPRFFFHYAGFEWVRPLPAPWMTVIYVVVALAALGIALGAAYRASAIVFFLGFTYTELIDVTRYLNHYYLASLLALLFVVLPLHRTASVDAWLRPSLRASTVPAWVLWLLRFQVGLVYFFAALAKAQPDWLLHGQPLGIWLTARTDTPVIGRFLDEPLVALGMSWAGFLYDLTITGWLSWKRSRPFAYAVVLVFHFLTSVFFNIGMFPVIMTIAATLFFDPSWPRALAARLRSAPRAEVIANTQEKWHLGAIGLAVVGCWALFHVAMPLRTHLYGGDVLWHEQGMRWSWRVMVRAKNGDVIFRVRSDRTGDRELLVPPSRYLTREQEREMGGQPDLILQVAHRIRDDLRARGHQDVEVRADALVSLNGRRARRIIDPGVDLARVEDGVGYASWILPGPEEPPVRLRSHRERLAALGR